ncbi:hypothetical protein K474DRAFT_1157833 [Panus rudis PR-1116 ss-1]|nr:hypothetical protein K474DRAFT_1157833 [Panus rudis PR-1116 ss-1]
MLTASRGLMLVHTLSRGGSNDMDWGTGWGEDVFCTAAICTFSITETLPLYFHLISIPLEIIISWLAPLLTSWCCTDSIVTIVSTSDSLESRRVIDEHETNLAPHFSQAKSRSGILTLSRRASYNTGGVRAIFCFHPLTAAARFRTFSHEMPSDFRDIALKRRMPIALPFLYSPCYHEVMKLWGERRLLLQNNALVLGTSFVSVSDAVTVLASWHGMALRKHKFYSKMEV